MRDDEDEAPKDADKAGPKIKMNKIGKKAGQKGAAGPTSKQSAPGAKVDTKQWDRAAEKNLSTAGFSE